MDWRLEENIRLGKTCDMCKHGAHLVGHPEIFLCMLSAGERRPVGGPITGTCLEFEDATDPKEDDHE